MCLIKVYDEDYSKYPKGFKCNGFKIVREVKKSEVFKAFYKGTIYEKDKWYTVDYEDKSKIFVSTESIKLRSTSNIYYPNGFHIYSSLQAVKDKYQGFQNINVDCVIVYVKWSGLLAKGEDNKQNLIFVTKRLKVLYRLPYKEFEE